MIAVDYETYYSDTCTVVEQGYWHYPRHPEFEAYLVSIFGEGIDYCGPVEDFDWSSLDGRELVSHNAAFDESVTLALIQQKKIADFHPAVWEDSADLSAYVCGARSLKDAAKLILGVQLSKDVRDKMKGKRWNVLSPSQKEEVMKYARDDTKYCLQIWCQESEKWPEIERWVSRANRYAGMRGVPIDTVKVVTEIKIAKELIRKAELEIPWSDDKDAIILSHKKVGEYCRMLGIEPPASLAEDSDECSKWEETYGGKHKFVAALRQYRKANTLLKKLEVIMKRVREDGFMGYELRFFGAAGTGRFSGSAKFNIQNLPRAPWEGIYLRSNIAAPEGSVLVVSDFANIEPRVGASLVGDKEFLDKVRAGVGVYEVHARNSMGWAGGNLKKEDPLMYALAKARVLSLGYGAGWQKFITMAATYGVSDVFNAPVSKKQEKEFRNAIAKNDKQQKLLDQFDAMTEEEKRVWVNSWLQVSDFRKSNPKITAMWRSLDDAFRRSAMAKDNYVIELPSGRELTYYEPSSVGGWSCKRTKAAPRSFIYGGAFFENCLTGETLIVTDRGVKPIKTVTQEDSIWDGEKFVTCKGAKRMGEKEVGSVAGIRMTSDHKILDGTSWKSAISLDEATLADALKLGRYSERLLLSNRKTALKNSASANASAEKDGELTIKHSRTERQSGVVDVLQGECQNACETDSVMLTYSDQRSSSISGDTDTPEWCPDATQIPAMSNGIGTADGGSKCGRSGEKIGSPSSVTSEHFPVGTKAGWTSTESITTETMSRVICGSSPEAKTQGTPAEPLGSPTTERECPTQTSESDFCPSGVETTPGGTSSGVKLQSKLWKSTGQSLEVYDLIDCGPNHRFAVALPDGGHLIVHNCCQAVARDLLVNAWKNASDAGLDVLFTVHDEIVILAKEKEAEEAKAALIKAMEKSPDWMPDIPLEVEAEITKTYKK